MADLKRTVSLNKVVSAAIVDTYEDINKVQQLYSHWAARGLKKLNKEVLKSGRRYTILTINKNTNTATLPIDFDEEVFVGLIIGGIKYPFIQNSRIVDSKNIEEVECEDKCEKCNQNKQICEDITITEDTVLVTINDVVYEQTIIKKLYPNGEYYLETKTPVYDIDTDTVIYTTSKQFVAALSLKPCGCLDDTEANIEIIKTCCYDVWCKYYSPCGEARHGSYKIFEETGLIQFHNIGDTKKVYLEYTGFLPKKNGQYQVPEVAFETLVNWTKFKAVENKRNIPLIERKWTFDQYLRERNNMRKVTSKFSLYQIIKIAMSVPKFDVDFDMWANCATPFVQATPATTQSSASTSADSSSSGSSTVVCTPSTKGLSPFQIAVIAGMGTGTPTDGVNTYQLDALKGAVGLNLIIVNNANETILAKQFTFDSATGIITRYQGDGVTPNNWATGDVLIINFSKFI